MCRHLIGLVRFRSKRRRDRPGINEMQATASADLPETRDPLQRLRRGTLPQRSLSRPRESGKPSWCLSLHPESRRVQN